MMNDEQVMKGDGVICLDVLSQHSHGRYLEKQKSSSDRRGSSNLIGSGCYRIHVSSLTDTTYYEPDPRIRSKNAHHALCTVLHCAPRAQAVHSSYNTCILKIGPPVSPLIPRNPCLFKFGGQH